jgi:uncharacterized protein (DUF736 family)
MIEYENKGILFKNDYKKDNEKAPDYKGKINVEGKEFELAAWVREGNKGKFMSLSVSEPYDGGNRDPVGNSEQPPVEDEPLPF